MSSTLIVWVGDARAAGLGAGDAGPTVRVTAPDSQRVEVAGSFSGWEPVPLRRTADGWEAQVTLGSGRHRVAGGWPMG